MLVRLLVLAITVVVAVVGGIVLATVLFPPPQASERLAGVAVSIDSYTLDQPAPMETDRHRIDLKVTVESPISIDTCMAFALDAPFAGRRLEPASGTCVKPVAGSQTLTVTSSVLTDDDLAFPSHTLVWGVKGGRCGLIMEAFGVCVVEQAGTAALELPYVNPLGSFPPFGSFPIFSFEPYSFAPP